MVGALALGRAEFTRALLAVPHRGAMHQECALRADNAFDKRPRPVKAKVQAKARHLRPMLIVGMVNGKTLKPEALKATNANCSKNHL